jgi:hypothetical protein
VTIAERVKKHFFEWPHAKGQSILPQSISRRSLWREEFLASSLAAV